MINKEEHLELFRQGFEESPNSQVIAEYRDGDVHILHVNKAFTNYYGYTIEDVLDGNPRILNSGIHDINYFKKMWDAILNPEIGYWRDEIVNKRKDGRLIHVLLTINTIFNKSGIPIYFTAYHIDITARKNAEEKLKNAYNQSNLFKDIIAHDINNILQIISSSLELSSQYLKFIEEYDNISEYCEIIDEQVIRATTLISNVRKLSEIEDEEVQIKSVDIREPLEEAINYIKSSYQQRNIEISLNVPEEKIRVIANELILDVFENLLINSIRHSNKTNVEIIINIGDYDENFVMFEFQDNGQGINDERKEFIFKKSKDLKKKKQGMGLGLSLVKKIIESYSGNIWVEDRVKGDFSKGASFVFLIPKA